MASSFQREVGKLNIEHQLGLYDPDSPKRSFKNSLDYQSCRDAKNLWLHHHYRWEYVVKQFITQASGLRSQWVPKPRGDPTTTSFGSTDQTTLLKNLFKRLLQEESDQCIPPSTIPLSSSEELEMMLIDEESDLQILPQSSLPVNASQTGPYPGSLDMVPQPGSSWLDEFERQEQDDNTLHISDNLVPHENNDGLALNHEHQPSHPSRSHHFSGIISGKAVQSGQENSHTRKRCLSTHDIEKVPRKPKTFDDDQVQQPEFDKPNYSFTGPRESFALKPSHNASSCAPSVDTSFRSVFADANESFVTNATSLSFNLQTDSSAVNANASSNSQAHSIQPSSKIQKYVHKFKQASPFDDSIRQCPENVPFPTIFEVQRVALDKRVSSADIFKYLGSQNGLLNRVGGSTNLDRLWAALLQYTGSHKDSLPTKSSDKAWKTFSLPRDDLQYSTISLTGTVSFGSTSKEPLLDIKLNPLSLEQSNRLKRKYGSDRLLVLGFPSLEASALPEYLKADASEVRLAFIEWLTTNPHYLLGREWRAFYVKSKPRTKSAEKPTFTWRVYFFAVDGHGFKSYVDTNAPKRTSIGQMLDWFFCVADNQGQHLLKLFSRIQLLVSDTTPAIVFKHSQIIQQDDIMCQGVVMTDGCARISLKAAQIISRQLGLPLSIPSAFQARIAGAKGMWVVDTSLEPRNGSDIWIEISSSQTKFESLLREKGHPDKDRVTFEVHDYSRPLRPAPINFQLLPILIDRNVDASVFTELLGTDLDTKVEELEESMSQPQALRAWNQEQYPTAGTRLSSNGVVWEGGMPRFNEEAINALAEAGYVPATCGFLWDLCKDAVKSYCTKVEKRMNIYPGQATYAYMVPDFWGVLEQDQIHLGFSSAFTDKRSQWSDTLLNSIDVLVARLPATLPSDIHKVRAVFRPELAHLKDVVVFPTKGNFCLADKLSGGDYDGDRAWICWNDVIVAPFKNFPTPLKKKPSEYGIEKDSTLVRDVWQPVKRQDKDASSNQAVKAAQFIKRGFEFNMRRSLLGRCTNLHEAYCYKLVLQASKKLASKTNMHSPEEKVYSPMHNPIAMEFANLLGYLVDTAKNGFTFTDEACNRYLASIGAKNLPDPAYKIEGKPSDHIIDQLVLQTAVSFRQGAMKQLDRIADLSGTRGIEFKDKDLIALYQNEKGLAEDLNDSAVSLVLRTLIHDIEEIYALYTNILLPETRNGKASWSDVYEKLRRCFLDLQPASGMQSGINLDHHPIVQRWQKSTKQDNLSTQQSWYLLAASALYNKTHLGFYPWRVCGKELMALKLLATNDGVSISRQMHQYMKFDRKMWENAKLRNGNKSDTGPEDEIGQLDEDEFMGFSVEMMYESQAEAE